MLSGQVQLRWWGIDRHITTTTRWLKRGNTLSGMTNTDFSCDKSRMIESESVHSGIPGIHRGVLELQAADCNGVESSFLARTHHFNEASVKWRRSTLALCLNRCTPRHSLSQYASRNMMEISVYSNDLHSLSSLNQLLWWGGFTLY